MSLHHKQPSPGLRVLLQMATFLVCLLLTTSLIVTSVLVDLRLLTSSGGIKTILTGLMNPTTSQSTPPAVGALGVARLKDSMDFSDAENVTVDDNGDIWVNGELVGNLNDPAIKDEIQLPENIEIPSHLLDINDTVGSVNAIVEYIYDMVADYFGEELPVTLEQVQTFVQQSTVMDFLSAKIAAFAEDILGGTQNTTITTSEIMQLVEANQQLAEETFNIVITDEMKQELETQVAQAVEGENGINQTIHTEIQKALDQPLSLPVTGMENASMGDLVAILNRIIQLPVLLSALAVVLILVAAVLLLHYYDMAAGLCRVAITVLTVSIPLALPVILLQFAPQTLQAIIPDASAMQAATSVVGAIAPMHYGLLISGVVLLAGSIVWSCLRRPKTA